MSPDLEIEIIDYYPPGVTDIIASSFSCFLGPRIHIEAQIYTILGDHDRIIKFKGVEGTGIRLEYATYRSVAQYLRKAKASPTTSQRLTWAQQAAEGMAYIHKRGVLHCDTNANNLLLDRNLNIKFADFQGRYLSPDGTIALDGLSSENVQSYMPRSDPNHADQKTDIFAFGSAIYFMMTGHEPFPELDSFDDDDEAEILGGRIVHNCWAGAYGSASEVAEGFQKLIEGILDM
ncbi:kinase-like domain-containing protein [Leptodontidium sp. MPI-SDFR-AT-0119]|nr:kinase-like domain-containing protein [Leptodontidium sp. MPI-SDFR-AT-0119]